jgi:glutamate racemase
MNSINSKDKPIGLFDSGVGGISVLRQAIEELPKENFIYFGDSKNAPYGTKSIDEVKALTFKGVEFLLEKGVKAIVIACNTATSAAIEDLRNTYSSFPVIGIEPALKPAVELRRKGKIIIMATPMTLSEIKFSKLVKDYGKEANIVSMPCPGLVEMIERGIVDGPEMEEYLTNKLEEHLIEEISSIVLGCTHYPFIKSELSKIIGEDIPIIDGSNGTAKQLRRQLLHYEMINESVEVGDIQIYNSLECEGILKLSRKLLKK